MKHLFALLSMLLTLLPGAATADSPPQGVRVICWHSVQDNVDPGDQYSITPAQLVEQLEYLRTHGYHPVSMQQVLLAMENRAPLPPKPVLLTFDDAYQSYYAFVFPLLKRFGYPSVLAVVGSWIENAPPDGLPEPLMTWEQIRTVARSERVEIASHSYDLHRAARYTPQGNVAAVVSVRSYKEESGGYETPTAYRQKLARDFSRQSELFNRRLGLRPRVLVWPYGRYNSISNTVARENGMACAFHLEEGLARLDRPMRMNRILATNQPILDFINKVEQPAPKPHPIRAVQVDLDLIYDPQSAEQTDRNLGELIDRLVAMGVNTVFLQAFADPEGTGNVARVYFHNRVMPVAADIFGHAVHQMIIRDMQVYAWMPTLSLVLPGEKVNARYRVREIAEGHTVPSRSWYHRLTPFSGEVRQMVRALYEDMAAVAQVNGILFQDDAYLTDREDYHPLALENFGAAVGRSVSARDIETDAALAAQWTAFKTRSLIDFLAHLKAGVRRFRPDARFARNLYANVLVDPASETRFAQNYAQFLDHYDYVVVMAYPQMEKARQPLRWLGELVGKTRYLPGAADRTIFKLQAFDWEKQQWIDDRYLLKEMRRILASGGRHIAYYPDNLWENRPGLDRIVLEMSARSLPRIN